jgi:hypothetical protein
MAARYDRLSEPQSRRGLNATLRDECRGRRTEPPARERCERIINAAIHAREEQLCAATFARLSELSRERLDVLLPLWTNKMTRHALASSRCGTIPDQSA